MQLSATQTLYLRQVLGMRWLPIQNTREYTLAIVGKGLSSGATGELLDKMIAAMKLDKSEVIFFEEVPAELPDLPLILILGAWNELPIGSVTIQNHSQLFVSHDLQSLIEQPHLKKQTWVQLQKIMTLLSS